MKTPMQELIEWIRDYDNRNLTISRYDIDRKLIELLEKEDEMITKLKNKEDENNN
jgi:hypothetical protein